MCIGWPLKLSVPIWTEPQTEAWGKTVRAPGTQPTTQDPRDAERQAALASIRAMSGPARERRGRVCATDTRKPGS